MFYECATSSEELPPTRLSESGVHSILDKLKVIVGNHNDWLERMERHLIYEAGVDHDYIKFVANFQTVDTILDRQAIEIMNEDMRRRNHQKRPNINLADGE